MTIFASHVAWQEESRGKQLAELHCWHSRAILSFHVENSFQAIKYPCSLAIYNAHKAVDKFDKHKCANTLVVLPLHGKKGIKQTNFQNFIGGTPEQCSTLATKYQLYGTREHYLLQQFMQGTSETTASKPCAYLVTNLLRKYVNLTRTEHFSR